MFLAALLLSGCTTAKQDPVALARDDVAPVEAEPDLHLRGHVLSPSLVPVGNATVTVVGLGDQTTDQAGSFDYGMVGRGLYSLTARAAGFAETSLTVTPEQEGAVRLVLMPGDPVVPYRTTVPFTGIVQCAFEAVIISPSCDSAVTAVTEEAGHPVAAFDANNSFLFQADRGWKTLVIDVVFDGEDHPGLDGLRIAVRGSLDPDGGGQYVQYGRWHDATSFVARLEPGGDYTDGTEPVPANATGFQVDVYPQSHAYHATCVPAFGCPLGVGAAQNVRFDVFATLFYVDPAPQDWSFVEASA